tara:strand:+ start:1788 stop:1934 length:147 start_codon:yes stop_codon:yes gene_type:complete
MLCKLLVATLSVVSALKVEQAPTKPALPQRKQLGRPVSQCLRSYKEPL